ncbi:MAG: hypothetical protein R3C14_51990 [Caldilineaceae bacterium]
MYTTTIYKNLAALEPIKRILSEVDRALHDQGRTIGASDIPEILGAVAGGAAGVPVGFMLVSMTGVAGISAAGLTSGLAGLGALVGGGMLAGIFVAGAPMAAFGITGYALTAHYNKRKLALVKEALLQEAIRKHDAIIRELNNKINRSEERNEYLNALNAVLRRIIQDLEQDLAR